MSILFYGDPHGSWQPLFDAVAEQQPSAVILLGDMDLDERLDVKLERLLDTGIDVRWIAGNHDSEHTDWHDRLFLARRGLGKADLNGRIQIVGGFRVAGLGGVFRRRVWDPNFDANPDPAKYTRDAFYHSMSKSARWRKWIPMKDRTSIFPEDLDALREAASKGGEVDVLVSHEAPSAHEKGFTVIDQLARDIGARLIVHGHHHYAYERTMPSDLRVRGLAKAEPWRLLGREGIATVGNPTSGVTAGWHDA